MGDLTDPLGEGKGPEICVQVENRREPLAKFWSPGAGPPLTPVGQPRSETRYVLLPYHFYWGRGEDPWRNLGRHLTNHPPQGGILGTI